MNTLTIADLAQRLKVSRQTINRMRKAGELPAPIKTERRLIRWRESDVTLWLDELDCPNQKQFELLKATKKQFSRK